jgi:hypothetical protein
MIWVFAIYLALIIGAGYAAAGVIRIIADFIRKRKGKK